MNEMEKLSEILASSNVITRIDELKPWLITQVILTLPRPKTKQAWQALIEVLKENTMLWKLDFSEELEEEDYAYLHQLVQQNQTITHVSVLSFLLHQKQDIAVSRSLSKNSTSIIFLGRIDSGKSELMVRFLHGDSDKLDPTVEDSHKKKLTLPNQKVMQIEMFDTSDTEKFSAMRDLYMKDGDIFVLCFSTIASSTFYDLFDIRDQLLHVHNRENIPLLLVGTQSNLEEKRVISFQEAYQMAQQWNAFYVECDQDAQAIQKFEKALLQLITNVAFPQPHIRRRAESFEKCKKTQTQLAFNQQHRGEINNTEYKFKQRFKLQKLLQSSHTTIDDISLSSYLNGEDILYMAALYNRQDIIKYVIETLHTSVNQEDQQGRTALQVACLQGNQGLVEFLLNKKADIDKKDKMNHDAIQMAQQHGHADLVGFLQEYKKEQALQRLFEQQKGVDIYKKSFIEERKQLHEQLRTMCEIDSIGQAKQQLWQFLQNTDPQTRQYLQSVLLPILNKIDYPAKMLRHEERYSATEKFALRVKKGSRTFTSSHPRFYNLSQIIGEIKALQKILSKNSCQPVLDSLEKIVQHYHEYIDKLNTVEEEDEKKVLPCIPVSMISVAIEPGIIKKEIEVQLLPYRSNLEKDGKPRSTHHVVMVQGVYFKKDPHAPGVEYMVASLGNIITNRSTPPTELIKIVDHQGLGNGPIELCYLASKTVQGTDLQHIIEKKPELLDKIHPDSFSASVVLSLLTDPQDGKPDNYFVEYEVDEGGQIKSLNIIGIDNDMAFADPVVKEHRGERKGQHFVNVKNVLYFFPQMQEPVSKTFREKFLKLSPEIVTLQWLQGLYEKNKEYEALLAQEVFTKAEFEGDGKLNKKGLQLPIRLVPNAAINVYDKLIKIQAYLEENLNATHEALFRCIEPFLYECYAKIKAEKGGIMACIKEVYAQNAFTIEEILNMESRLIGGETRVLTEIALRTAERFGFEDKRYQTIKEATEEFIAHIDYSRFSDGPSMKVLSETIDYIDYIDYANVFYKAINAKTESIALFDYLRGKGVKSTDSYPGQGTFFHVAASCGATTALTYMLEHGVDITSRKQNGETALHVAASKGQLEICVALFNRAPSLLDLTDNLGRSALDRALENRHQNVSQFMIRQGAGTVLEQHRPRFLEVVQTFWAVVPESEKPASKKENLMPQTGSSALKTPPMLRVVPPPPVRPRALSANQQKSGISQTSTSENVSHALNEVGLFHAKRFTDSTTELSVESEETAEPAGSP